MEQQLSRKLSRVLRHGIITEKLRMNNEGYVRIDELLNNENFTSYKKDDIIKVVANNDKQRFKISDDGKMIRANQGHSKEVGELINDEKSMKVVGDEIQYAYHGTTNEAYNSIKKEGLKPMSRKHIHMSLNNSLSGYRANCQVLLEIDVTAARADGVTFYESDNGVILTSQQIHKKYIRKMKNS